MKRAYVLEVGADKIGSMLGASSLDSTLSQVEIGVVAILAIVCVIEVFCMVMLALGVVFGVYLRFKAFKSSSTPQLATVRDVVEA